MSWILKIRETKNKRDKNYNVKNCKFERKNKNKKINEYNVIDI